MGYIRNRRTGETIFVPDAPGQQPDIPPNELRARQIQAQTDSTVSNTANDSERLRIERERLRLAQEEAARKAAEDATNLNKQSRAQSDAASTLERVLGQLDDVERDVNDGWGGLGETGFSGARLRDWEGTAAYDLQRKLDMVDANTAFARLDQMRQNSPTGGALGNVTEKELDLLKSSISSLDPNQSQREFLSSVNRARQTYEDNLRRLTGQPRGGGIGAIMGRSTPPAPRTPPRPPASAPRTNIIRYDRNGNRIP